MTKLYYFLIIGLIFLSGCNTLSEIGFCYTDEDGKQYCGNIGLAKEKTENEKSVVLEESTVGTLYTFSEEEVSILADYFEETSDVNVTSSKTFKTNFSKCKDFIKQRGKNEND